MLKKDNILRYIKETTTQFSLLKWIFIATGCKIANIINWKLV